MMRVSQDQIVGRKIFSILPPKPGFVVVKAVLFQDKELISTQIGANEIPFPIRPQLFARLSGTCTR